AVSNGENGDQVLAVRGTKLGDFYVSHPNTEVLSVGSLSRIEFPSRDFVSAYKPFQILSHSPESPVRISMDLRTISAELALKGCRGLSLQTFDVLGTAETNCQPSEVNT